MRTDKIHQQHSSTFNFRPRLLKINRKRRNKHDQDFRNILDGYLETVEELEEYPLNLPRHTFDFDHDIEEVS